MRHCIVLYSMKVVFPHGYSSTIDRHLHIGYYIAWCASNGLSCNADKTEAVHISSCYSISEKIDEIRIDDAIITPTLTGRDLGTIVDHQSGLKQTC